MGSYSDYRKKKKEEVLGASSEPKGIGTYGEYSARKRIGLDTLESDLNTLGSTISNVYSGWQDADTMAKTRTSVEDMQKRLGSYQEYQKKYGGADLSDIASGYQSVLDDWDNLSSVYGYYQNADAYNSAVKKSKMDKDFGGLSYDDVQSKLKEYKEGSDEHKYLSEYMGYSDLRDFDKALSNVADGDYKEKLQAERNKYALDNTFDLYKDRMNAENFEETSQYVSTKADGFWDKFTSQYGLGYKDLAYEYINDQNGMRSEIKNQARIYGRDSGDGISSYEKKGYDKLNDDEIAVYNSLYAEDPEEAQKFLDDMEITLTKRVYDENTQRWEEIADSGVVGSTLASAFSVPANLLGAFTGTMENIKDSISGKPYNPYGYYKTPSNFSSDTRQYVSENIEEATEGMNAPIIGNVGSFLYNTGMSMADSTFGAMTMGKAFTPLLGLSASQQKAKELTEAGASEEEVFWTSLASGVAEAAMEYTAIDNLFKVKNTDSAAKIFTNAMKQAGAEGLEEVGTEVINTIADTWIRGDSSELAQMYEELLTRGFTEKEAKTEIAKEFGTRVGQAFLGGAFSGGVMGGVYSGNQKAELGALGQTIRENHAVTDLQDIASGLNNDAYADYLKLIEGNKISNAKLGNLYTEVENEVSENYEKEKSNAQMRPMADRAIELGDTKNSGMIASTVTKYVNGEKLSAEEKAMLKTDTAQTILADTKRGDIQVKATDSFNKAMDNATKMRNIVEMPIDEKARRARVAELNVGEVTEVTSTGNSTKIDGIRVEDGSTIVLTSEGEVKAEDMTFSAKDAEMLSYAENMSPDKANLFLSQYDGKVDVEDYRNSFNMAYSYGEVGFAADTVLKNKGVLTEVQASEIYKQSLKMASDRKQKVIDEINEKQKGNTFVKGTFDDSIINYKGNTTDKNKVSWSKLTPQQRSAITFAKGFSKATGVNIKFIKSNVVNGEHKGKNGSYNPSTNTIEIDVYAGRIDAKSITDSIVPTLSHEVTHWMKAKSPAMYNKMKEHIAETLAMNDGKTIEQRVDDEMVRMKSAHSKMNVTPEMAIDEIIARSCEDMLSNSEKSRELLNGLTKTEQNDLVSKIKDTFKNLIKWVNDLLDTYKSNSEEAKILREYESRLKELSKMWDEALAKAIEANQSLQHEGIKGETAISKALEEIGLHFDAESETVYSYRSLEDAFHMDDADAFVKDYKKNHPKEQYSDRDTEGNTLTEEQQEYFKDSKVRDENGNLKVMYHGTEQAGFTTFRTDNSDDGISLFFTDRLTVAKGYSGINSEFTPRHFKSLEDLNGYISKIDNDYYAKTEGGEYVLYDYSDDAIERSKTLDGLYEEFEHYYANTGASNYKVYLNIINPLEVDAQNNNWDDLDRIFDGNKVVYETLSAKVQPDGTINYLYYDKNDRPVKGNLSETEFEKTFGHKFFKEVVENDGEFNTVRERLVIDTETGEEVLSTTREYAEYAKKNGYDGVIFNNVIDTGLYASGRERFASSTVVVAFNSNQIKSVANTEPTEDDDIRYSDRETDLDSRTLLANALESVAQNEEEREKLAKYKSKIERANSLQFKLDAIRMQIKELNYLRDAEKIASLKKELKELEKKVDYYDRQLLRLEVTEPLKKIASRAWRNSKSKAVESYKDQIEKKAKVEGITQKALVLGKWLNKNSPKEHIVEPLKPAVAELVNAINFSSRQLLGKSGYPDVRGLPTNQDKDIAKALANLRDIAKNLDDAKKEAQAEESFLDQLDLPEFLLDELKNLTKVANALAEKYGKSSYILNEMSLKDLEVLDKVVTELKTICSTANESFAFSEKQKISELGDKFIASNDEFSTKKMNNLATEYLEYDNSTPYYVFKRMGTVGRMMFDAFMDGQERYAFLADQIEKDAKDIFSEKEAEEWSQKTIEIRVLDTKTSKKNSPQYKTLQMTVAHAMSIYALSRREAAKPHLYGGGIRIKDFKLKHHINKITDAYGATLSKKEVEDIIGNLDSRQREVAEKIQEYMSTKSAELGNYVTMKRWGIKQFTEKLYFPMETIKNGQNFDRLGSKDNSIYRLLNSSFTKALTPNANNKLVIDNIFDVFVAHTTDMAKYRSFALPMLDTIKILGYSKREATDLKGEENGHDELTVSSSIVNAFGEGGLKYIINLMKDLNSVETTPRGETIPKKLMSNYKVAAVGANLRVVLLQGTAYVKAAYNIEAKYLIKAMATNGKKASEKAMEHSGIALWKSKGNYDLNISRSVASRIKQEQSFAEKVKEKSLDLAGKADARTWGHLWKACEYWATDNTNFEKGSDKFYEAVSKRFREIIVSTQVVDSTLTRTQLMRSKSAMVQTMTAFMSEAAMTYNMLSDAFFEWGLDARREGKSYKSTFGKHGRKFARAAIVWSLTNVATSLAGAVVDAGRDDDDEKGLDEKYLMALLENLKDNFNPIGILPIFRDVKSIMEGFSPTRYDMQSFSTLYNAYKKWVKVAEGDGNIYQAAYKTLQGLSQLSGMPFSNQVRDVLAMWNSTVAKVFPSFEFKDN